MPDLLYFAGSICKLDSGAGELLIAPANRCAAADRNCCVNATGIWQGIPAAMCSSTPRDCHKSQAAIHAALSSPPLIMLSQYLHMNGFIKAEKPPQYDIMSKE